MIVWGINALNHDASIAVLADQQLVFWKRSSDFSLIRGDQYLDPGLIKSALEIGRPQRIIWYERPVWKKTRQFFAGQYRTAFDLAEMPGRYLHNVGLSGIPIHYVPHHLSHAAAGYLTSPFREKSVILVADALGEWDSCSIWLADGFDFRKIWSRSYPNSVGLFYSAFTRLIGLRPVFDEGRLQTMSHTGDANTHYLDVADYFKDLGILRTNLHHGVWDWQKDIDNPDDLAASVQKVFEEQILAMAKLAKKLTGLSTLVYMGGCAFNSDANEHIKQQFDRVWSLWTPGDSSSSLGCALYHERLAIPYGTNDKIQPWTIRCDD